MSFQLKLKFALILLTFISVRFTLSLIMLIFFFFLVIKAVTEAEVAKENIVLKIIIKGMVGTLKLMPPLVKG